MPPDDPRFSLFRFIARMQIVLMAVGFFGLLGCKLLQDHLQMSEQQFMRTTYGGAMVWSMVVCWLSSLLLIPVTLILRNRADVEVPRVFRVRSCFAWGLLIALASMFLLAAAAVLYKLLE